MAKRDNSMLMIDIIGGTIIFLILFLIVYSFVFYQNVGVDWRTLSWSEHWKALKMIL